MKGALFGWASWGPFSEWQREPTCRECRRRVTYVRAVMSQNRSARVPTCIKCHWESCPATLENGAVCGDSLSRRVLDDDKESCRARCVYVCKNMRCGKTYALDRPY